MNKEPIVLSHNYVYVFTAYYAIAAVWGVVSGWLGVSAVMQTGGDLYQSIWSGIIVLFSAPLAVLTLLNYPRLEKYITLGWCAVVSVYPTAIAYQWLVVGDTLKAAPSISTLLYLVFPIASGIYLIGKTKKRNG